MVEIRFEKAKPSPVGAVRSQHLLPGEIPGAEVRHHALPAGAELLLPPLADRLRVLFLVAGRVRLTDAGGAVTRLDGQACHVPLPGSGLRAAADESAELLEILWALTPEEFAFVERDGGPLPLTQVYSECEQYRDYFKSEKTISRTIVAPHVLPRFCMGSVESRGPDRIEPHAHPMLDQFFYGFAENQIELLVDGERHAMGGNLLLHVPLGSDHGVEVPPGKRMHYLWIDFFADGRDMDYIVDVHKPVAARGFAEGAAPT